MFKQIIEKIVMGTKTYKKLKEDYLRAKECIKEVGTHYNKIETDIKQNKTIARKIVRLINKGLDKKDKTVVEVKALCNEIINRK